MGKGLLYILILLLPSSVAAASNSKVKSEERPATLNALCRMLLTRATAELTLGGAELEPFVEPSSLRPRLWVPKGFSQTQILPHELSTTIRYMRYLDRMYGKGDQVLLTPHFDGHAVPGFDGVVFDKRGAAVSNISLKSTLSWTGDSEDLFYLLQDAKNDARQKALRFATYPEWLVIYGLAEKEEAPGGSGYFAYKLKMNSSHRREKYRSVELAWRLFKIPLSITGRKTRIILDADSPGGLGNENADEIRIETFKNNEGILRLGGSAHAIDLGQLRKWFEASPYVESIVILKGNQVAELTPQSSRVVSLP